MQHREYNTKGWCNIECTIHKVGLTYVECIYTQGGCNIECTIHKVGATYVECIYTQGGCNIECRIHKVGATMIDQGDGNIEGSRSSNRVHNVGVT